MIRRPCDRGSVLHCDLSQGDSGGCARDDPDAHGIGVEDEAAGTMSKCVTVNGSALDWPHRSVSPDRIHGARSSVADGGHTVQLSRSDRATEGRRPPSAPLAQRSSRRP